MPYPLSAQRRETQLYLDTVMDRHPKRWGEWFDRVAERGLKGIEDFCKRNILEKSVVLRHIHADPELNAEYEAALAAYAEILAHEAVSIADTTEVGEEITIDEEGKTKTVRADMLGHRKLKVETRLKLASRWNRRRYGDKEPTVQVNVGANSLVSILSALPKTGDVIEAATDAQDGHEADAQADADEADAIEHEGDARRESTQGQDAEGIGSGPG